MHIWYHVYGVTDMAEICLECWRKLSDQREPRWKYVLSRELDLCEECGEWKRVIVRERFVLPWFLLKMIYKQ
jgi:hypothetical protein